MPEGAEGVDVAASVEVEECCFAVAVGGGIGGDLRGVGGMAVCFVLPGAIHGTDRDGSKEVQNRLRDIFGLRVVRLERCWEWDRNGRVNNVGVFIGDVSFDGLAGGSAPRLQMESFGGKSGAGDLEVG